MRHEPAPGRHRPEPGTPDNPGLLADDFWYIAHDDQNGRPRLHGSAISYGLAAALLGELAYSGHITFHRGEVHVLDTRPPDDWLQHLVLSQLVNGQQHTATRTWLAYFAETANGTVTQRLRQAGKVQPVQRRKILNVVGPTATVHVPTDINKAAWAWMKLSTKLRDYRQLDPYDLALAGICQSCRLDQWLLDGAPYAARAHLRTLLNNAPESMRDLLADLDAAVGATILSHRT